MLTEAEASFLRGAIRSHVEDMSVAGLISGAEADMAQRLVEKIEAAPLHDVAMWAKATVRRIIVNHGKSYTNAGLADLLLSRMGGQS
jgi:hypothetical protein